jgi:hypothetical protein
MPAETTAQSPILVTGPPRSGSTWVGRVIASNPVIGYVDEPLNLHDGGPSSFRFQHIDGANEAPFARFMQREIDAVAPRRALVKDPIALMSADWLAQRFDMQVVVLIRHPVPFVSSIKVLDWFHPWKDFLDQPVLMEKRLGVFEREFRALAEKPGDVIADARLLWRVCHRVIRQYQSEHPEWIFLRHEDLSRDPLHGFATMFKTLGVDFAGASAAYVADHSVNASAMGDLTREGDPYSVMRNSAANLWHWRQRLTPAEIASISRDLEDLEHFYPEPEWRL